MRLFKTVLLLIPLLVLTGSATGLAQSAPVPHVVGYQGMLANSLGDPVSDGNFQLSFSLYDDLTAGNLLWSEIHVTVSVKEGQFSVLLGSVVPIPMDSLTRWAAYESLQLYLEIQVASDPPLAPRTRVGGSLFSAVAQRIDGDVETGPGWMKINPPTGSFRGPGDEGVEVQSEGDEGPSIRLFDLDHTTLIFTDGFESGDVSSWSSSLSGESSTGGRLELDKTGDKRVELDPFNGLKLLDFPTGNTTNLKSDRLDMAYTSPIPYLNVVQPDGMVISSSGGSTQAVLAILPLESPKLELIEVDDSRLVARPHGLDLVGSSGDTLAGFTRDSLLLRLDNGPGLTIDNFVALAGNFAIESASSSGTRVVRAAASDVQGGPYLRIIDSIDDKSVELNEDGLSLGSPSFGTVATYGRNLLRLEGEVGVDLGSFIALSGDFSFASTGPSGGTSITGVTNPLSGGPKLTLTDSTSNKSLELKSSGLTASDPGSWLIDVDGDTPDGPKIDVVDVTDSDATTVTPEGVQATGSSTPGRTQNWNSTKDIVIMTDYSATDVQKLKFSTESSDGVRFTMSKWTDGDTDTTDIVKLSTIATEPVFSIFEPGSEPFEEPACSYEYDPLNRLIKNCRSRIGQPGDSTVTSSAGMQIYADPMIFSYDEKGMEYSNTMMGASMFSVNSGGGIYSGGGMYSMGPDVLAMDAALNVGIGTELPTTKLHVEGDICATGLIGPCSDQRYKEKIETIEEATETIKQLRGVRFDWRTDQFPDKQFSDQRQVGLIAQEVQTVLPEIVITGTDGYLAVDYSRLTPVLVEAVKQQQKTIENQDSRIEQLESELDEIKRLLLQLATKSDTESKRGYSLK